jgi:hypothetical protein
MRRYPRRRRSLPALRQANANQGVCWRRQRTTRTAWAFLHPLVLLHEQELQNDFGDACTLHDGVMGALVCRAADGLTRTSNVPSKEREPLSDGPPSRESRCPPIHQRNRSPAHSTFLPHQLRKPGDVGRNPPRLIARHVELLIVTVPL